MKIVRGAVFGVGLKAAQILGIGFVWFCKRFCKKNRGLKFSPLCTRSRDRTGTTLLSLVFETNASTNSAIRAAKSVICSAKVMIYRGTPNFFRIFLRPYCLPKWTRSLAALAGPTRAESSSAGAVRIFSTVRKWRNRSSMVFGPTPSIFSSSL